MNTHLLFSFTPELLKMKLVPITLTACCISLIGCKDISEVQSPPQQQASGPPPTVNDKRAHYPFNRTITDNQGRRLDVTILGKNANQLAFTKQSNSDGERFVLPIERLVEGDQAFFNNLNDGGAFEKVKEALLNQQKFKNRLVRWHSIPDAANREAEQLELPVLLVVLITRNQKSDEMESNVVLSSKFKEWAKDKLVLCCIKVDSPYSNHTTSHTAVANRQVAQSYGINTFNGPSLRISDRLSNHYFSVNDHFISSTDDAIERIGRRLRNNR